MHRQKSGEEGGHYWTGTNRNQLWKWSSDPERGKWLCIQLAGRSAPGVTVYKISLPASNVKKNCVCFFWLVLVKATINLLELRIITHESTWHEVRKNSLNRFMICFEFGCNWLGSSGNYMTNSVRQSHSDCRLTKFSLMVLQMQISFPRRLPLSRQVLIVNPFKWSFLAESISNSLSLNILEVFIPKLFLLQFS